VSRDHGAGVFLTIDELHYVDLKTLSALVVGLHRATQLRLPITIAGAGLPSLAIVTGEAKTYAERLFTFPQIASLPLELAAEALVTPALDEGVAWSDGALERVLGVTQCYPYFLQEFAKAAWDVSDGPDRISLDDVERSLPVAVAELDDGFFRVRTGQTSASERLYLRAMAELGPGPVRTAEVAALLGKKTNALAPTRDHLVKRAVCYSPRWGEIDFTVPMFGDFMKRQLPLKPVSAGGAG
jgi:hypothetical protein